MKADSSPNRSADSPDHLRIVHFRRLFSLISETFIFDPLQLMRERGAEVSVLSLVRLHRRDRPFPSSTLLSLPGFLHPDAFLARVFALPSASNEMESFAWPLFRKLLKRKLRRLRPNVIHAHFGPDGCLIAPVAEELGIPLVVTFYGYDVSRLVHQQEELWRDRYGELFRVARALVGISNHISGKVRALGASAEKVDTIHLGTDLERFHYRNPSKEYSGGPVRFLHVGRLTAKKAPLHLIRSFALARQRLKGKVEVELDVVGEGELMSECRRLVLECGLEDVVRLHGGLSHTQVASLMGRAHVYAEHCLTAPNGDMEGLGVTFVEASACGLPVVSTLHNGIPEVVLQGKSGLLSEEGDIEAMTGNLEQMALQPDRWGVMGDVGYRHVRERFTLGHEVDHLFALYRRVLEGEPERRDATVVIGRSPSSAGLTSGVVC